MTYDLAEVLAGSLPQTWQRTFDGILKAPGAAYGVVQAGRADPLVYASGLGQVRQGGPVPGPDTVFRIASMTKSFTAALVSLLISRGQLALADPVERYVPELKGLELPGGVPCLRVDHLLSMGAGFPTDDPWGDRQQDLSAEAFSQLLQHGLTFAWTPGTRFEYSNLGYALLGRVIEAVTQRPYREVLTAELLTPFGLLSTGFDVAQIKASRPDAVVATGHQLRPETQEWFEVPIDGYGAFAPMGGLLSTVRDLSRWVAGYLQAHQEGLAPGAGLPGCAGGPTSVIPAAVHRELQQSLRLIPPVSQGRTGSARGPASGYAWGLVQEYHGELGEIISHSGGYPGFGSHMRWHPATGIGVVVLANGTYAAASQCGERMLADLVRALGGAPDIRPAEVTLAAQQAVSELLAGWATQPDLPHEHEATWLSMNVDLDRPVRDRAHEVAGLWAQAGVTEAEPVDGISTSPTHRRWLLPGTQHTLVVEIRLTPTSPARVQTLEIRRDS